MGKLSTVAIVLGKQCDRGVAARSRRRRLRPVVEGCGYYPQFVFSDQTSETLAAKPRAYNARSNTVNDHVEVFDAAIGQLPVSIAKGRHCRDDPELAA
jgi:hypothetical protein